MWETFGVSVKEVDTAIGQFGTGLKYAIAVLVREGRSIMIRSGGVDYVFGAEKTSFRGKEFQQITCNGESLPFTTHLGAKWEIWMAYREIYSNCLDEGGCLGDEGETVIYAEMGDVHHGDVFLDVSGRNEVARTLGCTAYIGSSDYLYCKGVRIKKLTTPSLYTYNFASIPLTEDRTVRDIYKVYLGVAGLLEGAEGTSFPEGILLETKGFFEESMDLNWPGVRLPRKILDLASRFRRDNVYMQKSLLGKAIAELGASVFSRVDLDNRQKQILEKASAFCEKIGYPVRYPVYLSFDLGCGVLGLADVKNQDIYLSDTVMDQGVKQVAATLIEENIHILKGYSDETYEMQNYLFDQIVTMGEKLTGEIL